MGRIRQSAHTAVPSSQPFQGSSPRSCGTRERIGTHTPLVGQRLFHSCELPELSAEYVLSGGICMRPATAHKELGHCWSSRSGERVFGGLETGLSCWEKVLPLGGHRFGSQHLWRVVQSHLWLQFQGIQMPCLDSVGACPHTCAYARTHTDAHTVKNTFFKEVFEMMQAWVIMAEIQRLRLCGAKCLSPSLTLASQTGFPLTGWFLWVKFCWNSHAVSFLKVFYSCSGATAAELSNYHKTMQPTKLENIGSVRKSGAPILVLISVSGNAYCFLRSGVHLQSCTELPFCMCYLHM